MALESTVTLSEKLSYLNLSDEESQKALSKFLVGLGMLEYAEFIEVINRLRSYKIEITKAKDIKVIANGLENIEKKISILDEIHEVDVYRQDPSRLNCNEVLKLYQRIQKCKQTGIQYKREDGTYESFLFNEYEWKKMMDERTEGIVSTPEFTPVEEDIVTLEPIAEIEPVITPIDDMVAIEPENEPEVDNDHIDIQDYMANAVNDDFEEIQARTTNFAAVREELEGFKDQLSELDALRSQIDFGDEISFADLEPESFGGRAVWNF